MKYSIIIPTLNEEKLLPGLLESLSDPVLKIKYDFEVIVSDNGSSDSTLEIAREYSDQVLCREDGQARSISACRSKGAQHACGSILLFINADVRIDIEKILSMVEEKFVPSDYVAMTCPIKCVPELENFKDKWFSTIVNSYYYFSNLIGLGIARGEFQLIRRHIYEAVGGYKEGMVVGEDYELFTRIRKHGRVWFSWDIMVYESPRRYRSWGYFRTVFVWLSTSMGPWFRKKPSYKDWEQIR